MIGLASPSRPGIGLSAGRASVGELSFFSGEQRYAVAVYFSNCFSKSARSGRSITLNVPLNKPAMYSEVVPGAAFYAQNPDPRTLRLSFVTLTPDLIAEGVAKLGVVLKEAMVGAAELTP